MSRYTTGGTQILTVSSRNIPGGMAEVSRARTDQLLRGGRPAWADDPTVDLPCQRPDVAPTPDSDIWFPVRGDGKGADDDERFAASFCQRCPRQDDCLEFGLANGEWGVWGGVKIDRLKVAERDRLLAEVRRRRGAKQ